MIDLHARLKPYLWLMVLVALTEHDRKLIQRRTETLQSTLSTIG